MKTKKSLLIFGDSYSTFDGYIPEGYQPYYYSVYPEERPRSDVSKPEETWWGIVCRDLDLELIRNDSWSGSTVCYTGYNGDCSSTNSFIYRFERLISAGFFDENEPDTLLVFGGTNDSWANAPIGELKLSGQTREELFSVLPAVGYFAGMVKEALPRAEIFFIINTGLKPEIAEGIRLACRHFGHGYIELSDIDKVSGHPGILGMSQIAEQVKSALAKGK